MRTQIKALSVVVSFLALLACAPSLPPAPTGPTSSLEQERAYNLAQIVALHANAMVIRSAGTSMLPSFGPGAIHVVETIGDNRVHPGDVLVFKLGERTVIHRVVRSAPNRYLTRGDANVEPDGWVNRDDVIGRIIATFHPAP